MSAEQERWEHARGEALNLQDTLLKASGGIENTESALQSIAEEDKKEWADHSHSYMVEEVHAEVVDKMERQVKNNVIDPIEANRPEGLGMTASEKTYSHGRVQYIKSHLEKLEASAVNAPSVLAETETIRTNLDTLSAQITADPRLRHPRPKTSRRGMTPRQRRRNRQL